MTPRQEPANPTMTVEPPGAEVPASRRDWARVLGKIVFFAVALFLFILAIQLMKEGAKALAPALEDSPLFSNAFSTLGCRLARRLHRAVGLAGGGRRAEPVRRAARPPSSRRSRCSRGRGSGASFVVLLVGFLYAMRNRGRNRSESIGMGVLALSLTAIVYIPGMLIGYAHPSSRGCSTGSS